MLNASPIVPCFHRRQLRYKVVTVYDDAQEDIAQFFEETNRYIAKVKSYQGFELQVLLGCLSTMASYAEVSN